MSLKTVGIVVILLGTVSCIIALRVGRSTLSVEYYNVAIVSMAVQMIGFISVLVHKIMECVNTWTKVTKNKTLHFKK